MRVKNLYKVSLVLYILLVSSLLSLQAQQLPAGFTRVPVVSGLIKPTAMAFAPDGRIFILEQAGSVRVVKDGKLLATPFVKLKVSLRGEGGLLGIAFDPEFVSNQLVYLYYTLPNESNNRISSFKANGDIVVAGSEKIIWVSDSLNATIHHAGTLRFKDNILYAAIGDNYNPEKAQDLNVSHGKIIRINRDGSIPAGNPYTSGTLQKRKIWASGLRNPFSFDIDPVSGNVFVNDVGYNLWEEINNATTSGKNFGWPRIEGASSNTAYTNPLHAYNHGRNDEFGCAITGGAFFNPTTPNYPQTYQGKYFFIDFCAGWMRTLTAGATPVVEDFATGLGSENVGLTVGKDGNLYYIDRGTGTLYKIIYTTNNAPAVAKHPASITVAQGQPATFTVTATGKETLSYQWQKNSINIPGATSETYTIDSVVSTDAASYRVKVSNSYGTVYSNAARLTVAAPNDRPVATIITPKAGTLYRAGESITFSGSATDKEDGELAASQFTWYVDFYHDTHNHAGPPVASGVKSGSFQVPTRGEVSDTVWYRVTLIVKDLKGLTDTTFVDVHPRKSVVQLTTQPAGLQLKLDGHPVTTPYSFPGVEGVERSIGGLSPQTLGGKSYEFSHWVHGGASDQTISTPVDDTTFTAVYTEVTLRAPVYPTNVVNGLSYQYFEGKWSLLPDFQKMTPIKSGTTTNFSLTAQNRPDQFAFRFTGYLDVPADGEYTLYTSSDDGSKLFIGTTLVVNNDGWHSLREASGKIGLRKGKHPITVDFMENGGSATLYVRYEGPGIAKKVIPASALFRDNSTTTSSATRIASTSVSTPPDTVHTAFRFYPNPAHHQVTVEVTPSSADILQIIVRDPSHNIVLEEIYGQSPGLNTLIVNTSSLTPGLYFIECFNGKTVFAERLIIR